MALFAKDRRKQVADLEAKVTDSDAALTALLEGQNRQKRLQEDAVVAIKNLHATEVMNLKLGLAESNRKTEEDAAGYARMIAHLEGQVEELKVKGKKYDSIIQGFIWHSAGSVELDGRMFRLMEARTDVPLANFRLPILDGQEFP